MTIKERIKSNPGPDREDNPRGLSWAAYIGAATGVVLGVILALLGAAGLHWWMPESRMAEIFWEVGAPLLAFVGLIGVAFFSHRHFSDQLAIPVVMFFLASGVAAWLAFDLVGIPWREEMQKPDEVTSGVRDVNQGK